MNLFILRRLYELLVRCALILYTRPWTYHDLRMLMSMSKRLSFVWSCSVVVNKVKFSGLPVISGIAELNKPKQPSMDNGLI